MGHQQLFGPTSEGARKSNKTPRAAAANSWRKNGGGAYEESKMAMENQGLVGGKIGSYGDVIWML